MATATGQAPRQQEMEATVAAVAQGATATTILGEVDITGTVSSVIYYPNADITGANTDSRTVSLVNKGADGNGSTAIATLAMVSGVNSTDFNDKTITLSGTAANLDVTAGDVLAWVSTHVGNGLADPGGRVVVTIDLA